MIEYKFLPKFLNKFSYFSPLPELKVIGEVEEENQGVSIVSTYYNSKKNIFQFTNLFQGTE